MMYRCGQRRVNALSQIVNASSNCTVSICSLNMPAGLYAGSYTWWIAGKNANGYGPWTSMNFVVHVVPGAVQHLSPIGAVANRRPTLTWQRDLSVSWYGLWLDGPRGNLISQWYEASNVCAGSTCTLPFNSDLQGGLYSWWMSSVSYSGESGPVGWHYLYSGFCSR